MCQETLKGLLYNSTISTSEFIRSHGEYIRRHRRSYLDFITCLPAWAESKSFEEQEAHKISDHEIDINIFACRSLAAYFELISESLTSMFRISGYVTTNLGRIKMLQYADADSSQSSGGSWPVVLYTRHILSSLWQLKIEYLTDSDSNSFFCS
jgi:hypothetical protein